MMKRHVLVVDDNYDIRSLITATLGTTLYEVGTAANGEEALDYLGTYDHPDLVILDLAMPGMSGLEVLEQMKSNSNTMHITAIILSAQADERMQNEAFSLGARAVLSKPFSPLELLQIIDEVLE